MDDTKNPRHVKVEGHWFIKLYGPDGVLKQEQESKNVITTVGLDFLASFLNSAAAAAATFTCRYIGIGTDATSELVADTTLGVEAARQTGTASYVSNAIYQTTATFASGSGTGAIVEYGLFSSNTNGTMFSRLTDSVINKGANDTLVVTTKVTLT